MIDFYISLSFEKERENALTSRRFGSFTSFRTGSSGGFVTHVSHPDRV